MTDPPTDDTEDGVTLLGAEMLTWSDMHGRLGGFGGPLWMFLDHDPGEPRGRLLVAGPHLPGVIADLVARFDSTDVLLRSFPDARDLAGDLGGCARVLCGALDRVKPHEGYDAIFAVSGIDRLNSAEEEDPGWRKTVSHLCSLLSDNGELFLGVGNDVGLDGLLSLHAESHSSDADWPPGKLSRDPQPRASEVVEFVGAAGLDLVATWACHGGRDQPRLAASDRVLRDAAADPLVQRLVGRAYLDDDRAVASLKDPVATAHGLVRAGLGAELAPLTILHLRRGRDENASDAPPDLLWSEAGVVLAHRWEHQQWRREVLGHCEPLRIAPGLVWDPSLLGGNVDGGVSLADHLARCCASNDVAEAAAWVRRYRDWLAEDGSGNVDARRVGVRFADLSVKDQRVVVADPGAVADQSAPADVVLLRALLDFGAMLLRRGVPLPWESSASAVTIAVALAAAIDLEATDEQVEDAISLDALLRPSTEAVPDFRAARGGGRAPRSYADLLESVEALTQRATDSDAHVAWLLRSLQTRQRTIRRSRGRITTLEHSPEYRVGKRVLWFRTLLRRWVDRLEARRKGPAGEWRDPASVRQDPVDPNQIEEQLIPPGHTPPEGIEVIASRGDEPTRRTGLIWPRRESD